MTTAQMPPQAPPKARAAAAVDALLVLLALGSLALTAWSLSTLLHDQAHAPWPIAGLGVAVFDVPAVSASLLVYHRRRQPHTALGARIVMTGCLLGSAVVNGAHGAMMAGWTVAAILAAAPLSFEVVFELRHRTLTAAIWFLFRREASEALRRDAWTRIAPAVEDGARPPAQAAPPAVRQRSAREVLRERFAAMDPADAVLIAAQSHPKLNAVELAELLADYGVTVDALTVALVLGQTGARVTVERAQHGPQQPAETLPEAEQHPALTGTTTAADTEAKARAQHRAAPPAAPPPSSEDEPTRTRMVLDARNTLGEAATAAELARHVAGVHGVELTAEHVRAVLSRAKKAAEKRPPKPSGGPYL